MKLVYPEGEIDFIAALPVTSLPALPHAVADRAIPMEHPVEIALKTLRYRGRDLKPRDIFDIAVVAAAYESLLVQEMACHVAGRRASLLERLHTLRPSYLAAALAELDVRPAGRPAVEACSAVVAGLVEALPRTDATEPHYRNVQQNNLTSVLRTSTVHPSRRFEHSLRARYKCS